MTVRRAVDAAGTAYAVTGWGYEPSGAVRRVTHPGGRAGAEPEPAGSEPVGPSLRALAEAAVLCSDAALAPPTGQRSDWQAVGDPVEAALLAFAGRCGVPVDSARADWPRRAEPRSTRRRGG